MGPQRKRPFGQEERKRGGFQVEGTEAGKVMSMFKWWLQPFSAWLVDRGNNG